MEGDFLDGVYWEYMYDGENAKRTRCPGGEEAKGACPVIREDRNIFYENRFLGLPRFRYSTNLTKKSINYQNFFFQNKAIES